MRIWQTGGQQACAEGQRVQRCTAEHQTQVARAGKASAAGAGVARRYAVGECGDGGALLQSVRRGHNQSSTRAGRRGRGRPAQRETGYDADSGRSGGGRRAHARHEGKHAREPIGGTECARRKARGCPICGERAGQQAQARGSKRSIQDHGMAVEARGNFRGGRRGGQGSPRATSKLEIEVETARSIAAPATGFASCKFGHYQNEYQRFLRPNFRTPEGQQQLLWKGLLRLEVQQGIATVYSTYGNGLAEGEGLATSRERRAAKGSWVARCKED
ncbi:hypothetical protein B0H14DRAFT_3709339 [Mycena olivaceomarginata]|nr:hypothetical protein B0H14DRAFT_3709339 [Mycena olivaceomarginata]